jgi:hypothetical protein
MLVVGRARLPCSECAVKENRCILIFIMGDWRRHGLASSCPLVGLQQPDSWSALFEELKH